MFPIIFPFCRVWIDPLPMHGRDLGMNSDDMIEPPEQEAKQEILENKDVRIMSSSFILKWQLEQKLSKI